MFIRIMKDERELLLNLDHVSKIEVWYVIQDPKNPTKDYEISSSVAATAVEAIRKYRINVGGEWYLIDSDPSGRIGLALSSIYEKSLKA